MKKIAVIILTVLMLCSVLTVFAVPAFAEDYGNWSFDVLDNGEAKITFYNGSSANIEIPSKLNDHKVTSIGDSAFFRCTRLKSVVLPSGLKSIGNRAFSRCTGLTSLTLHDGLESIGDNAFDGCAALTSLTLPSGLKSIGGYAFNGCAGLTGLTLHAGLESIGDRAFNGCTGLTSLTLPSGLKSIGGYAFNGCAGLTSLTLHAELESIGMYAFAGCEKLKAVTITALQTEIGYCAFGYIESRTKLDGLTLSGMSGSTAEQYANENGIPFNAISCPHDGTLFCNNCDEEVTPDELLEAWGYTDNATGSVLSKGNLTIICAIAAAVVFGLGGFFIGKAIEKKKEKPEESNA